MSRFHLGLAVCGVCLLITGGLRIPGFMGGQGPNMDPLFARLTGVLLIAGYVFSRFVEDSIVLLVGTLLVSVAFLLIAMVRGVTR